MKTVKHWISWELSWIHEPCEKYHKALMVDPMYEISPLNVCETDQSSTRSLLYTETIQHIAQKCTIQDNQHNLIKVSVLHSAVFDI